MDRPPPTAPTVPVRRHDRWSGGLIALAVGFILVAIVKPWPAPPVEPAASPDGRAAVADARRTGIPGGSPTATPVPLPAGAVACRSPDGWRVVTVGPWLGVLSHSWIAIEPLSSAADPADPRIPFVDAGPAPFFAIGACAPGTASGDGAGLPALVTSAWRLGDSSGDPPRSVRIDPTTPLAPTSAAAQLYAPVLGPAADPMPAEGAWPAGRYVLEVAVAAPSPSVWMGVTITPGAEAAAGIPTPAATLAPAASPRPARSAGGYP